jgi:hypothetical protein
MDVRRVAVSSADWLDISSFTQQGDAQELARDRRKEKEQTMQLKPLILRR